MKYIATVILFWVSLLWGALPSVASVPPPPKLKSSAYLLQDFHSGRIIAEANADVKMEPASITKMMTTYLVFKELRDGNIKEDEEVLISEKAWRQRGSKMFIEVGKKVSVGELLKGMIIQSGNDATVALSEYVAGNEATFVSMMNKMAQDLGMTNTHFENSTGWPSENHYTSARDIAKLAKAMIKDFPKYYELNAVKEYTFNNIKQYNRNKLLWRDDSVDGIKTGHTESAGYCLVSSAKREDMRLISVVFGASSDKARAEESQVLLNYGFRFFETHKLYKAGQSLQSARVWKGAGDKVELGLSNDMYVTIERGQHEKINTEVVYKEPIIAPVEQGTAYGELKVTLEGDEITTAEVYALGSVERGGLWRRMVDEVKLWF